MTQGRSPSFPPSPAGARPAASRWTRLEAAFASSPMGSTARRSGASRLGRNVDEDDEGLASRGRAG